MLFLSQRELQPLVKELALLFLKLGATAFGGPAAHIAMMEEEIVKRRKWITHEHFLDLLGATNLIPGPNSTEMAIHIGYVRAGLRGVLVAGFCFVVPAILITLLFAELYVSYGSTPQLSSLIFGIRAAIIAVIAGAVFRLSKPVLKKTNSLIIGVAVIILNLVGVNEILLLFSAGMVGLLWNSFSIFRSNISSFIGFIPFLNQQYNVTSFSTSISTNEATLTGLGLFFLKIGSILYGSGYVLVAFLQSELVNVRHWLTQSQLLDAIAVGQFTPGPLSSTATFIGYIILGLPGAIVATAGMFLPSFIFVLISSPFIPKIRKSQLASGFLDGVNAASLGLMFAVTISLATSSLTSIGAWLIFLLAGIVVVIWNLNAAWIVVGSALVGWLFSMFTK
ncbi:MAG: chromate efflux transporter [Ignavibacteriales bacterium]|nr:chromate efflux transporter [Ignavibacteriales bacterium]